MTSASGPTAAWRPGTQGGDLLPSGPAGRLSTPAGDGHGPETGPPTVTIGSYPDYPTAQRVVDYLADNRFPVEHSAIVGTNLTLVETVLGRMTTGRAGLLGAGTGAWFGLFIGLLFGIFTVGNWLAVILVGLVIGAIWGAVFGAVAHAMTGGQRDFTSASSLRAGQYAVTVDAQLADQARQLLGRMRMSSSTQNAR
ncbi:general stress protein [Micromonospora sp. NPDC047187]|uniref:general stress protein n=1 Tax=Micromonospora sp. NPDC047187 TaxID=3155262 RepID=UPI0033EE7628